MDIYEKAAEILVKCGYAIKIAPKIESKLIDYPETVYLDKLIHKKRYCVIIIDPFQDRIESRRQSDAIEDWLSEKIGSLLWAASENATANQCQDKNLNSHHQWRLDRIKWCLTELTDEIAPE